MRSRSYWFKIGCFVWLLLILLAFALVLLHGLGLINAWLFPFRNAAFFLGGGATLCWGVAAMTGTRSRRAIMAIVLAMVLGANAIAYGGAYTATHFVSPGQGRIGLPRPQNTSVPSDRGLAYKTQKLPINAAEWLETWLIPAKTPQGTVLLFPGNGGSKGNQLLPLAAVFHQLGYNALLVDFRGVGGSSGNTTTIGAREAEDVVLAYNYVLEAQLAHPYILYGVSMGSAAILKAVASARIKPNAILLELPFARLVDAVKSRLKAIRIPPFPTAELIVFWGSVQHRFNGFAHNPANYAKQIDVPTLILQGERDNWVSKAEIEEILANLRGQKQLVLFPTASHQLLITVDKSRWTKSVQHFLETLSRV
jgi:alpha-beta hydrolase superfamily lysophospholipase